MEITPNRNLWIDYLRSSITILVVSHHSSLAYTTFAWFDNKAYINSTHAIVDTKRWIGLDIFENFNDVFFMSLMFLIGGLFLAHSIKRKGINTFVKDRFFRLFIPFLFLGTFLMLVAYFPSYYVCYNKLDILDYVKDFFGVENWPVGPPWFIWVLFLFNILLALFYKQLMRLSRIRIFNFSSFKEKPFLFFAILFTITWTLYVPLAFLFGANKWIGIGPFDFQISRILLYFGYFLIGVFIGDTDFNKEIFSKQSTIVKRWWLWLLLSFIVYSMLTLISDPLKQLLKNNVIKEFQGWMIYFTIYVASCTISCIAFITTFRKIVVKENYWLNSLSDNAYLIYLVHYIFVVWIQFLLMNFNIPAFVKFIVTFTLAVSLSWTTSILLRKISIINKYL
ncbi:MAG: acyltransferase [Tenuifilaceae bacterium]|jgi:surface polysaccharide O-acyltransferase-like enzyme|nr:acyltransferase [Tenuifilaceae bacterium]